LVGIIASSQLVDPLNSWSALLPETRREVALPEVVEQRHEASRALAPSDALDPRHVGAGGLADEEARAREPPAHPIGILARHGDPFIDDAFVQDRGNDILGAPERLEALDPGAHFWRHTGH